MSAPVPSPEQPPADEATVRAFRRQLRDLAARYGITRLRYASPGRLVGHVEPDRDMLDVAEFDVGASFLLGASVMLFSDRVLTKPNVSPDLTLARPLD